MDVASSPEQVDLSPSPDFAGTECTSHQIALVSDLPALALANDKSAAAQEANTLRTNADYGKVPAVLDSDRVQKLRDQFIEEFTPKGPTEAILVEALARHAAAISRWDEGSAAIERQAARSLPDLANGLTYADSSTVDVALAGAMSTEAADRGERHSLLRSRAFLRTLEKLEAVQAVRRERESRGATMPPLGFADESACERYLTDRLRGGMVPCPECGGREGCVISTRKCWECRGCKLQIGLRANTVMARSPVSLRLWFDAVRILYWWPTINAATLAEKIGLMRVATVRSMMAKIRTAMTADNASERLAGLDRHFARYPST